MSAPQRVKVEPGIWQRGDATRSRSATRRASSVGAPVRGGIIAARNELDERGSQARELGERDDRRPATAVRARLRTRGSLARSPRCAQTPDQRVQGRGRRPPAQAHREAADGRLDTRRRCASSGRDARRWVSEWTISTTLMVCGQVFRHAARRMGWRGTSPMTLLERGEHPHVSATAKRRMFRGDELRAHDRHGPRAVQDDVRDGRGYRACASPRCSRSSGARSTSGTSRRSGSRHRVDQGQARAAQDGRRGRCWPDCAGPDPTGARGDAACAEAASTALRPRMTSCSRRATGPRSTSGTRFKALRAAMKSATYDDGRPVFPILP